MILYWKYITERKTMKSICYLLVILFYVHICNIGLCDATKGISNLVLKIDPPWVKRGSNVRLYCNYDLDDAPLYSVKWYRGNLEFYRYSPFEHPPVKIFQYTGIKVDQTNSNATQVTLRNVGFNLSGNITCEVTVDAPSFYTAIATNILTVVELPQSPPKLWTNQNQYEPGDMLVVNCSLAPSKPTARLTILLNNIPIGFDRTIQHYVQDNMHWASREISIRIAERHFINGQLLLRCEAEIAGLYEENTEMVLGHIKKEPIPERVRAANTGTQKFDGIFLSISSILLNILHRLWYHSQYGVRLICR